MRRSRLDKLLDQAQKAGCDVALAKMVLATRLVVLTWLIWTKDPFAPLRALVDNKNIIFLLREMGAELKMTTLQVASWDQLINWWALRSNKMQTKKMFCWMKQILKLDNSKLGSTQQWMTLTCCQDHILTENIWFVWSETSYSGDERRCYRCGTTTNKQWR